METIVVILAFAISAFALESRVTRIKDGPVSDKEFQAAVEWQMNAYGIDSAEASDKP